MNSAATPRQDQILLIFSKRARVVPMLVIIPRCVDLGKSTTRMAVSGGTIIKTAYETESPMYITLLRIRNRYNDYFLRRKTAFTP